MPFMFENLEVYQKAVDFTDRVVGLTEEFPRGYGFRADQLNRASL
ncbi:MAG: four helix bundle protein [Phycisphaerales bacterium]|nr:MAG: four helix bundle protein [Phycisphaerales bacterium]